MASIHRFPNAPARAPARPAPAASVFSGEGDDFFRPDGRCRLGTPSFVRPVNVHRLAQATRDDGMIEALAAQRIADAPKHQEVDPLVSWPAKVLVAAVWVVCCAYCVAIWTGWAS